MRVMRWIFRILVVCGCWRPNTWTSPFKMFLYNVYTMVILLLVYSVTFLQFMDIVMNVRTQNEFSDNFYMLLAMLVSCHKIYSLLDRRESIVILTNILEKEPFVPVNSEEIEIRTRFNKQADLITLFYTVLVELTVAYIACATMLTAGITALPYRMWLPCNCSSVYMMSFAYVQQVLALTAGSLMHVACDGLICSLLIHTNSQIEIFGCRLRAIKRDENESANSCVRYHEHVHRFVNMVNTEFGMVISIQFAVSTLVVCFSLYQLTTTKPASIQFLRIIMYTSCMLTQIFVYCWYGNEIKSKSLDISNMIFETDWISLDNNSKKVLLMIMRRASVPIELISIQIVPMNLETFVNILKTSYSAYNVLQQGQR